MWGLGAFAALVAISISAAHAEVLLNGRVTDENNAAVSGAKVTVMASGVSAEAAFLEATSDGTGAFRLRLPSPGDYRLNAQREGFFQVKDRPLTVTGPEQGVTIILQPASEVHDSTDVVASPPGIDSSTTNSEHTITGNQIIEVPYPSNHNLTSALRILPNAIQDRSGAIHIDGGGQDQVMYTLNGFNISDPLTGQLTSRLSLDSIHTVDVTSGRLAPEFGKDSAGTMALRTTTGDDKLRYSATNFIPGVSEQKGLVLKDWSPRFNVSGPISKSRAWYSDSLQVEYIKNIVPDLPKGQDRANSWRFANLLSSQVSLTPSNVLSMGFLMNYWYAPKTGLGALTPPSTTLDQRQRQWFYYLRDQIYFHNGALIEFGYAGNETFARQIPQGDGLLLITPDGQQGNAYVDGVRKGGRQQAIGNSFLPAFHWLGRHQIKTGVDFDRVTYSQNISRTGYENFRIDNTVYSQVLFAGSGVLGKSTYEASSYIQDSWSIPHHVLLEFGLRQDWNQLLGNSNVAPRAGIAWSPRGSSSFRVSGGYGIIYEMPSLRLFTRPADQYALTTIYDPAGNVASPPLPTFTVIGPWHLSTPRYRNFSAALEKELPARILARVGYLNKRGSNGLTYGTPDITASGSFFALTNSRRDSYDSVEFTIRQSFRDRFEWLASYVRSRALSNSVFDLTSDYPVLITNNSGRMPWDNPNRFMSWAYLPLPRKNWAVAYLFEYHDGFPFTIQNDEGRQVGALDARRLPSFLELDLHIERRLQFRGYNWALRAGVNNITGHGNPNEVNSNVASPHFLAYYGGQGRTVNFRIRWLGKVESH
jgi:hypothetical protein